MIDDAPGPTPAPAPDPTPPSGLLRRNAWLLVPLALFLVTYLAYGRINQGHFAFNNYFVPLADAFLHGRLDLAEHPTWLNELVPFGDKFFVVYPPMPAVALVPFVWRWGAGLNQASVSVLFGALNVFLLYFLLLHLGQGPVRRIVFSLLFGFGTIHWYSAQIGSSWHFAQICALMFMFAALVETFQDRRPWLIGLLAGCAALSRLTTLMAFPFFVLCFLHEASGPGGEALALRAYWAGLDRGLLVRRLALFAAGLAVPLLGYFAYNAARFGSPFTTGYTLIPGLLQEYQYRHGFLAVQSAPRNLYAMFLQMPRYVDQFPYLQSARLGGLSLLFTTPAFWWAFKARRRHWIEIGCWLSIALIALPILLHADTGGEEFGYRYAMDFYPFLFILMVRGMGERLSGGARLAIALSFLVNAWGIWSTLTGFWA